MLSIAGITKKMSYTEFSFLFFILVPHTISFGHCDDISYSICWMSKTEAFERLGGNLWLNGTALKSISKQGKLTSLTVSPTVENHMTLEYGGSVRKWTFRISPHTKSVRIRGLQKPQDHPSSAIQEILQLLSPTEVFACGNGTLLFYRDEDFILAIGHTLRLPVKLESSSPSTLLLSWVENHADDSAPDHTLTLYHAELSSYSTHSTENTTLNHHRFTALDPCSHYVACVEIAGTHSLTCLSTITDPDVPRYFQVTSWNSTSMSLGWDCPRNRKFSLYLITAFFLNGTDHVVREVPFVHRGDNFAFTLSELEPCSRVKFGLQTVCQAGMLSRYSKMVLSDGNTEHSNIEALRLTLFGPDNYTLSWEVRNTSSISMFRVYHEGALQGTTLATNYTVEGLQPCQHYRAKVEALCGESVLMRAMAVAAHTGPHGVSELRYRSNDSTALWIPGTSQRKAVAFLYELSVENGSSIYSSRLTVPALHLPGLEDGKSYILDVWEECGGQWQSEHSNLCFEGVHLPSEFLGRSAGSSDYPANQLDFSILSLSMVLPSEVLQVDASEARAEMEKIVKNKLQELLEDFAQPARIEVVSFEPAEEDDKTEVLFMSFDASIQEEDVPLSFEGQLDYIRSLKSPNITVIGGVIYWDGPDLCAFSKQTWCPRNSLCINTLGSHTCVCQDGFYDVSAVIPSAVASHPVCNEKGLFSQCLDRLMAGGIAKPYLTSYIGGRIEVELNDGRCAVNESETLYFFHTSRKPSECGTTRRVNQTHIELQNTLSVSLSKEHTITRRDLKVIWKCIYPRHYVRNAHVTVDLEWLSTISMVEFNSSLVLGLSMTMYSDESYTHSYTDIISLIPEDALFFQLALQTNKSFAWDIRLQVASCWSTESTDPQDAVQGIFLEDGCPVDNTFQWLSVNGVAQESRFSILMFTMPKGLPIYFHCLAHICRHDEDCTKNCTSQQRSKRSVSHMDTRGQRTTVVSAGPLLVITKVKSGVHSSHWAEHLTAISIVAGSIGFLGITMLGVTATKAIMSYYEQLRLQ